MSQRRGGCRRLNFILCTFLTANPMLLNTLAIFLFKWLHCYFLEECACLISSGTIRLKNKCICLGCIQTEVRWCCKMLQDAAGACAAVCGDCREVEAAMLLCYKRANHAKQRACSLTSSYSDRWHPQVRKSVLNLCTISNYKTQCILFTVVSVIRTASLIARATCPRDTLNLFQLYCCSCLRLFCFFFQNPLWPPPPQPKQTTLIKMNWENCIFNFSIRRVLQLLKLFSQTSQCADPLMPRLRLTC